MRKLFFAITMVVALVLSGCGNEPPLQVINGSWVFDIDAATKGAGNKDIGFLKDAMGDFRIDIDTGSKKLSARSGFGTESGAFSVLSEGKDNIVLSCQGSQFIFEIKGKNSILIKGDFLGTQGMPLKRRK